MATPAKRAAASPTIGTHSGTFHCDEALGCYLLSRTAEFKDAAIVRSRELNHQSSSAPTPKPREPPPPFSP